jgi:heat shock protein HslJ
MACASGNKEGEFTKALQSTTTYSIENNRLTLLNPSGKVLVFRKVD